MKCVHTHTISGTKNGTCSWVLEIMEIKLALNASVKVGKLIAGGHSWCEQCGNYF